MKVGILGGGISGLSAAYWLKKEIPQCQISVFEKDKVFGGKLKTKKLKGIVLDQGANVFFPNKSATKEFLTELNIIDSMYTVKSETNPNYILSKSQFQIFPDTLGEKLKTNLLSSFSKLHLLKSILAKPTDSDQDVYTYGNKIYGKDFTQVILDSYINGVLGGNLKQVSMETLFPHFFSKKVFQNLTPLVSTSSQLFGGLQFGMGELIDRILECLKKLNIQLVEGVELERLIWNSKSQNHSLQYNGSTSEFDVIISTIPQINMNRILRNVPESLIHSNFKVTYVPITVISVLLPKENLMNLKKGFGFLVPSAEKQYLLNGFYTSWMFPQRYVEEKVIMSFQLGGYRYPDMAKWGEDEIIQILKSELRGLMDCSEIEVLDIKNWESALPQFLVGHRKNLNNWLSEFQKHFPNLYFTGQAVNGIGIDNCLKGSKKCVLQIKNQYLSR